MAGQTFAATVNGERVLCTLMSLDDYEDLGGVYTDGGNGGDDAMAFGPAYSLPERFDGDGAMTEEFRNVLRDVARHAYACAVAIGDGADEQQTLDAIGAPAGAMRWNDSLVGVWLLADFPASAPLEARMVGGEPAGPPAGLVPPATDRPVYLALCETRSGSRYFAYDTDARRAAGARDARLVVGPVTVGPTGYQTDLDGAEAIALQINAGDFDLDAPATWNAVLEPTPAERAELAAQFAHAEWV